MRISKLFLVLLPVVVAGFQIWFSNTSNLTRWKGGGFGMYTGMHPNNRSVWINLPDANGSHYFRVDSPPKDSSGKNGLVQSIHPILKPKMGRLKNFPGSLDVQFLDKSLDEIRQIARKKDGKVQLLVSEMELDMKSKKVFNRVVFRYEK